MDASRCADYGNYDNDVILVIAGTMSAQNKQLANDLSIHYIEQFEMKWYNQSFWWYGYSVLYSALYMMEAGLIKPTDTETKAKKFMTYLPYYA